MQTPDLSVLLAAVVKEAGGAVRISDLTLAQLGIGRERLELVWDASTATFELRLEGYQRPIHMDAEVVDAEFEPLALPPPDRALPWMADDALD